MEDISPVAGGGVGALLGGVMTILWQVVRSRPDPKLIDLLSKTQASQDRLESALDRNTAAITKLAEDVTREIGEVREANVDLRVQNAQQEKEIEGQARQIGILTSAQDSLRQDMRAQKAESNKIHDADQDEISRLKTWGTETEGQLRQANEDREAMEIRVKKLEEDNQQLRHQNDTLSERVTALEDEMRDLKAQWEAEREKRKNAEAQVTTLTHQLEERDAQLVEQAVELDRLRDVNATLLEKTKQRESETREKVTP